MCEDMRGALGHVLGHRHLTVQHNIPGISDGTLLKDGVVRFNLHHLEGRHKNLDLFFGKPVENVRFHEKLKQSITRYIHVFPLSCLLTIPDLSRRILNEGRLQQGRRSKTTVRGRV